MERQEESAKKRFGEISREDLPGVGVGGTEVKRGTGVDGAEAQAGKIEERKGACQIS